jgi:hypothetical protein
MEGSGRGLWADASRGRLAGSHPYFSVSNTLGGAAARARIYPTRFISTIARVPSASGSS